ncbi:MAG: Putative PAS/PAC sensor protein, partial [Thermotoga petrophila]
MEREKVELFKEVLKKLHEGENVESLKKQFGELLSQIPPFEIPVIEQELIKSGEIDVRDIIKMCDLHVEFFRGAVSEAGREIEKLPNGHPLRTLYEENKQILKDAEALSLLASSTFSLPKDDPRRKQF